MGVEAPPQRHTLLQVLPPKCVRGRLHGLYRGRKLTLIFDRTAGKTRARSRSAKFLVIERLESSKGCGAVWASTVCASTPS